MSQKLKENTDRRNLLSKSSDNDNNSGKMIMDDQVDDKTIERNAKFKAWLTNKSLRDRAIELLGKLSTKRAEDDADLKEVAIVLCAVDDILRRSGASEVPGRANIDESSNKKSLSGPKPLRSYWMKWAMETHNFNMVELSDEEVASLSAAVKEYLDTSEPGKSILPSLKYFFPAVAKKPGEKAKPLTNDQRAQNSIYMKNMTRLWKEAKVELRARLDEYVARRHQQMMKSSADGNISSSSSSMPSSSQERMELMGLQEMSVKQLTTWVEEDEDKASKLANEDEDERLRTAKMSHEQWVRSKDSLRIRIPEKLPVKTASISYGREYNSIRPQSGPSTLNIIQSMADSGLKYIHASGRGKQGTDGDLEKTRKTLLELGYVYKENFDDDEMHDYHDHKRCNPMLIEKVEIEKKMKEDSSKAYEEWLVYKDMREQALKCLLLLQPSSSSSSMISSSSSVRRSQSNQPTRADYDHIIHIGQALKKVDRTLFKDWSRWCESTIKTNIALILWDSFAPIACDVHSSSYSQVRDTFMKLLRPGYDIRTTFLEFAKKHHNITSSSSSSSDDKNASYHNLSLTKDQMQVLLRQMGIMMKESEMRLLIDAFDANNDGSITLQEMIDFIGPKRDKKSGSSMILNRRCCWLTSCRVTGMSNAYVVSCMPKNTRTSSSSMILSSSSSAAMIKGDDKDHVVDGHAGIMMIKSLPNGETRMCVELKERKQREDVLRHYHLLPSSSSSYDDHKADSKHHHKHKQHKNDDDDDDDHRYDDDNDAYNDDEFDDNDMKPSSSSRHHNNNDDSNKCDASRWSTSDRVGGLQYLLDITHDARQEEALKLILTQGKPPKPPLCYLSSSSLSYDKPPSSSYDKPSSSYDKSLSSSYDKPSSSYDKLHICWEAQPDDLISFYSLEYAGINKSSASSFHHQDNNSIYYQEIYRDPIDAHHDSKLQHHHIISNLLPATSYLFRIRAFNGYGPGEYTYKTFTTLPCAPMKPHPIIISSDMVLLRWIFSSSYEHHINELKRLYHMADHDQSGHVSRHELLSIINNNTTSSSASSSSSSSYDIKKMIIKAAKYYDVDISQGYDALFDMIEADDDGYLSYNEFQDFFFKAGMIDSNTPSSSSSVSSSASSYNNNISYVVERCSSEYDDTYVMVMKTNHGQAMISHLESGSSYRFRVYAINIDGQAGAHSNSIIIHTMLETPSPPITSSSSSSSAIGTHHISLSWKPHHHHHHHNKDDTIMKKMMYEWAGHHQDDDDAGVSTAKAFASYDVDGSGDIDASELAMMIASLGVEPSEERIRLALDMMDIDDDGRISYDEFCKWWRRDDVSYTIKRSEPVTSSSSSSMISSSAKMISSSSKHHSRAFGLSVIPEETTMISSSSSSVMMSRPKSAPRSSSSSSSSSVQHIHHHNVSVPIISYRGKDHHTIINGLEPNRLYHIKLRYTGSRSNSALSKAAIIMTKPLPPSCPIIIDMSSSTMRVKWYASSYGAYKFQVQLSSSSSSSKPSSSMIWSTVYMGQDTYYTCATLSSDTCYHMRIIAMNMHGSTSDPSPELIFTSPSRPSSSSSKPSSSSMISSSKQVSSSKNKSSSSSSAMMMYDMKNIDHAFSIECTHDICVGDTILITERLFIKKKHDHHHHDDHHDMMRESIMKMRASSSSSSMMSIASLLSEGKPESAGIFIGERTIAAHVVRDNYKTIRDHHTASSSSGRKESKHDDDGDDDIHDDDDMMMIMKQRRIWLEVIWSRYKPSSSASSTSSYELKAGEVIERQVMALEAYEVFRCAWKHEQHRLPLSKEWKTLKDCYRHIA